MFFKEFQDGCHGGQLGHQSGKILVFLNLNVAQIPPTKFEFNLTYDFGDVL